eukprot:6127149-Amphidinium_carterae.1
MTESGTAHHPSQKGHPKDPKEVPCKQPRHQSHALIICFCACNMVQQPTSGIVMTVDPSTNNAGKEHCLSFGSSACVAIVSLDVQIKVPQNPHVTHHESEPLIQNEASWAHNCSQPHN